MKKLKNGLEVMRINGYDFGYPPPGPSKYVGFGIYDHNRGGFICCYSGENTPRYSSEFRRIILELEQKLLIVFTQVYGPYRSKSKSLTLEVAETITEADLKMLGIAKPVD